MVNNNIAYYKEILERYLKNNCTPAEAEAFFLFLEKNESNKLLISELKAQFEQLPQPAHSATARSSRVLQKILQQIDPAPVVAMPVRHWRKIAAAAAAVIFILVSGYLFYNQRVTDKKTPAIADATKRFQNAITPGGEKAILVLSNGQSIVLDSAANGTLTQQGNTKVLKLNNGQLSYNSGGAASTEIVYNSIVTPRGGQYQVILPDGTGVWLNAASSLSFPTAFIGKERRVEVTGEAYFEVQKNAAMPFIVTINGGAEVEVLGTHFNIMAYADEAAVKTTLLEGAINMKNGNDIQRLKPGQQAAIIANKKMTVFNDVDLDQAIAWKNGLFDFNDEVIPDIMRQLSRWYDIDIAYEGAVPDGHYAGAIRRQSNIAEVLKMLEVAGGIHFAIEGKKVTVKK